jgi:ribonucleoside-triphosphate reductase
MLTVYDAGFITLDKQYLTVGLNGVLEAAEFLNMKPTIQDPNYQLWLADMLERIADENKEFKKRTGYMANTEIVPAENLGIKNYDWDKKDGYVVPENRNCYNSYFYAVEDDAVSLVDKFVLHGKPVIDKLDGGSALHANLDSHLPKDGYLALLDLAAKAGTNYFCFNVRSTLCIDCGHISKDTLDHCEKCGSEKVDHLTRIIGYLKRIAFWSAGRRKEHVKRHYHD